MGKRVSRIKLKGAVKLASLRGIERAFMKEIVKDAGMEYEAGERMKEKNGKTSYLIHTGEEKVTDEQREKVRESLRILLPQLIYAIRTGGEKMPKVFGIEVIGERRC